MSTSSSSSSSLTVTQPILGSPLGPIHFASPGHTSTLFGQLFHKKNRNEKKETRTKQQQHMTPIFSHVAREGSNHSSTSRPSTGGAHRSILPLERNTLSVTGIDLHDDAAAYAEASPNSVCPPPPYSVAVELGIEETRQSIQQFEIQQKQQRKREEKVKRLLDADKRMDEQLRSYGW